VLNHLISIEKYSSRLGNPLLTGRVEFQWSYDTITYHTW
jgi:hypothetical protein